MKARTTGISIATVLLAILHAGSTAHGQMPTGSVVGNVYDKTGAVVAGATITLRDMQTGFTRTTTSSPEGAYEFLLLSPRPYEITAEAKGFRKLVEQNIVVNVGLVVHVDLRMEVGDISQTVEVAAEIPLIEPDKTTISKALDPRAIQNLPLQGRQILELALTVPGTIPGAPGTQVVAFSVAGMRSQSNNYTLDGVSINDPQVNGPLNSFRLADAVQEYNVETSIASSEVGRNSGAQVSIITKSGGNKYHGSLFYFHRNDAFDANDFFLNRAGQKKNALRRHQFGGTIGGPIRRDKTFFFFSVERFRQTVQEPATGRVPDAVNDIPLVTDRVSRRLLQFWPQPNTSIANSTNNWTGTFPNNDFNWTYLWRVDHNLTSNHRLMGRYAWLRGTTLARQKTSGAGLFNGSLTNEPGQHSLLVSETYATGRVVNEVRVGFSRNHTFFLPADVATVNPAKIFTDAEGNPLPGFVDTGVDPLDGGIPNISITGRAGLGAGTNMPQGRSTNTYEWIDNLTLTGPWGWSRHTFRIGGEVRHEITNRFLNGNYRGQITFSSWANFAAGNALRGSFRTGVGGTFRTWGRTPIYAYFQDTFKAKPNLTLNYGIRWEYLGQSTEKYNRGSNFVPGVGMLALNSNLRIDVDPTRQGRAALLLTPTVVGLPASGQFSGDYTGFGPYLGIAYTPRFWSRLLGEGKTVIRTGFRLSYDDIFANIPVNMGLNFPPALSTTLPNAGGSVPFYKWGSVLNQNRFLFNADPTVPGGRRGIVSFNAWDTNPPNAYGMNYALEIERQLGASYAFELSYVGSQGRHLGVYSDANEPFVTVNDPLSIGTSVPNVRTFPFPQYASVNPGLFTSTSNYNGMVLTLRKKATRGLSFTASYTLGKSLDDNSSFFGSDRDNGSYADVRNRKLDYGRSGYDLRHRMEFSYVYDLPFGPSRGILGNTHGFLGQIVGGWSVSGITFYRSGFPFTVFAGGTNDYSGLNQRADRPNWAPGVSSLPTDFSNPDNAFPCHSGVDKKTSATNCPVFTPPGPGQIGNVGRNAFTGPASFNMDFGLFKSFQMGEARRLQFRAEFFNVLNHTNFNLPNATITFKVEDFKVGSQVRQQVVTPYNATSNVGVITSAQDPRLIQLGLRFDW